MHKNRIMSLKARVYVAVMAAAGLATFCRGIHPWESADAVRFGFYLVVTLMGSSLNISLPGIKGTMSAYSFFLLLSIVELTLPETLVIAASATLMGCYWHAKVRPKTVQIVFNLSSNLVGATLAHVTFHNAIWDRLPVGVPVRFTVAAVAFFITNIAPMTVATALTEDKTTKELWREGYFRPFPCYLAGALIAGLFSWLSLKIGWEASLLLIPVVIILFRSYLLYRGRLDSERLHAEEVASLHLRTIEALALAIEAKDHITHDHVRRVQTYALEVGKELGLGKDDLDALQAASVLHDIGKLAVPEHIISKPGRLSREEFEKMKIHPVVGAEILERVRFPYPVASIVRSHHEKWDGTGYPSGLKGEDIPIAARILSAVDCLDALASDRQYRRAFPLEKAMEMVAEESGASFDPKVVQILQRRHVDLESMARGANPPEISALSADAKVECGAAPAAGFEMETASTTVAAAPSVGFVVPGDFLTSIAAARQEVQALFEMAQNLGSSLSLPETLSVLATRLKQLMHFDALAIYVAREEKLIPEYVIGEDRALFSSLEIPIGQGLSGGVADNRKPIVNGNPSAEAGYLNDPSKFSKLNSALAVPLEDFTGVVGVLALYRAEPNAFTQDQLRIVQAITSKLAVAVQNSLMYRQAEATATTDYLTGLPNTRSLFMHLDSELSRCARKDEPMTVMVCDLDGFKQVNDRFGHLAGNQLLRVVATTLRDCCREYDYVARMGGDEFVIVLPGLDGDSLQAKQRQLEEAVERAGFEVCGERRVGLSVGQAQFGRDGRTVEDLLSEADRRMYKNKQKRKAELRNAASMGATREVARVQ